MRPGEGKWRVEHCSTQRNLSEAGITEANDQRDWVARLGIPFGKVYSSSACRTRIHAERVARGIEFLDVLTPPRSAAKGLVLRAMLNTALAPGTNTFMFAHGGILCNATDYDSVESETFVFRPAAADKPPILVASIKIVDWALLARGEACCAPRAYWRGTGAPIGAARARRRWIEAAREGRAAQPGCERTGATCGAPPRGPKREQRRAYRTN